MLVMEKTGCLLNLLEEFKDLGVWIKNYQRMMRIDKN